MPPVPVEVIVALIGALGAILAVLTGSWSKLREIEAATHATREQVENTHSTNLRHDLDEIKSTVDRIELNARAEHAALWHAITGPGDPPLPTAEIPTQKGPDHD